MATVVIGEMLTPRRVCEEFPLFREATLKDWRYRGTGPAWSRIGSRVYYRRSDVQAWLDGQYVASLRTAS